MHNALWQARTPRRISQMRLAKAVGIPFYRYWKIENEYIDPSPEDRAKIAEYLGEPEANLFFPDAPTTPPATDDASV